MQHIAVVGDVDFLLAHQLPVVTVRCAVVHVGVVRYAQAISGGAWAVIGHLRGAAHTPLTGVVSPGHARLGHLVKGFVDQRHVTGHARR
ncbi:hypothetical protein D3C72_1334890 [compost metagenome]